MELDATFWAFVSLIIFLALLIYLKVPGQVARALDNRADRIRGELEEARRLREEAKALLADFQRRRKEAEAEASQIVAAAKHEAELIANEARAKTEEFVTRRTAMAEQKIAQAEAEAIAEVRAVATAVATTAAGTVIGKQITENKGDALIDGAIRDLRAKLH